MSEQAIDGMLLGDAYITVKSVFGFNHSIKQQEYFDFKVSLMESSGIKMRVSVEEMDAKFIKDHWTGPTTKLNARSTKIHLWKVLRKLWYPKGRKIVPENLKLTPETLAYWYMDDGSVNKRNKHTSIINGIKYNYNCEPHIHQIRLYTDGFDIHSQNILENKLRDLDIYGKHYSRPDGHRFLVIAKQSSKEQFKRLVLPFLENVPSMMYKINHPLRSQFERLSEKAPMDIGRCDSPNLQEGQL